MTQPSSTANSNIDQQPEPVWTAERIRALGTVTDVPTAAAIFGLSRSVAYDLVKTGAFPMPVLRFGTRYRIPVAAILTALRMTPGEPVTDLTRGGRHASIIHTKSSGPIGSTHPEGNHP